jgi:hypothetical protein
LLDNGLQMERLGGETMKGRVAMIGESGAEHDLTVVCFWVGLQREIRGRREEGEGCRDGSWGVL